MQSDEIAFTNASVAIYPYIVCASKLCRILANTLTLYCLLAFDAVLALILVLFCRSSITLMQGFHAGSKVAISSVLMLVISLVYMDHVSEFLYFNF